MSSTKNCRATTRSCSRPAGPSCSTSGSARNRRLLPGEEEADIAGHSSRVLQHLGPQPEAERPQVFVPEFVAELGAPLQSLFPSGFRVVDLSAAVRAEVVGKPVDL